MMRRVVITGLGVVSCIGNDKETVTQSLRSGTPGIHANEEFKEYGFRSQVSGKIDIDVSEHIDRKTLRFMGDAAAFGYISMRDAIADSGLEESDVSNERTGIIMGSGGTSCSSQIECADIIRNQGVKRAGPYRVTQIMGSTVSACVATPFKIKGYNYSMTSACATSAHCIGNGTELIQWGKQDIIFAGGGEELHWNMAGAFDAMGALSAKYNDTPSVASRAYDANRDGFVISLGGGCVVLEEYEHAKARGAKIYGEVVGYGATSDGVNMVAPSGEGAQRCMRMALQDVEGPIDYINTHGTSTPAGDVTELEGIGKVLGSDLPAIGSTKSLSGHSLGAAGVHEAIFSLLMMENNFIAASANIETLDPGAEPYPIVREMKDNVELNQVMSNSFGFGGTNACLVMKKI